ncbi:hypothetical protein B0H63DRAFT_510187 [Podospora didyma]|uniref:Uncharacterized protein n=1 Tax=Podospora didyma TaxID=330526 RepID=A0AAE0NPU8_9PEZI|nr:hypothetical protein B0H63DRAFT_510187 [Podospora didyma]
MRSIALAALTSMLVNQAFASTGVLFNGPSCQVGVQGATCYGLADWECCRSAFGAYYESGRVWGDNVYWTIASYNRNNGCGQSAREGVGSTCLSTGHRDIFGVYHFHCPQRCNRSLQTRTDANGTSLAFAGREVPTCDAADDHAIIAGNVTAPVDVPQNGCKSVKLADVYWLAFPGDKERKPYAADLVSKLDDSTAIDWATHTFKDEMKGMVQAILRVKGDGLTSELKEQTASFTTKLKALQG